ncbi:MOSC domain-containing protein [Nocardioides sp. zg-1228]|uniref:MOSC domain-containing protein n=1 Tax=Nocardioides sp. zg-1228 TaxID=2763008 RepID=UPI00164279F6|nr:MOSC N-terminal beta barrel domain-containing protein [Nocardioides sp. zg-1228]MBC2931489.1 MOSC domain-containing protein [Nocardioides sp. zg-1228]QSF57095.1 MOSC domain-containing protein [Nocardioides sp. zg-1228]
MPAELVVRQAGFAPVKGMRHLSLPAIDLDAHGALGDRSLCLVDVDRARVLRTVQHPSLIGVVARVADDLLDLTLTTGESLSAPVVPSGRSVTCDYWGRQVLLELTEGPHAELLSDWLAVRVRLAAAPRGGVVFGEPLTVVGTASLRDLAGRVGHAGLVAEAARFRSTLVVETEEPYVEDSWTGRELVVGGATVRIGGPVPRCAVVDHHPVTGERDVRLLKALARERPVNGAGEPMLGVYAGCVRPGRVVTG